MVARGRRGVTASPDVLVVGAGPVGLTLALEAHAHGATVRIVDRRTEAFRPSRAMIVHPRTLECLTPLGVTDCLLERGDTTPTAELHLGGKTVTARLAQVALPDTPFPHLTMIRQMDVEDVLAGALVERGVVIERGVEAVGVASGADSARATLRCGDRSEAVTARFLVGCDGQASTVRDQAGIGFHGGTYREEVVLADAELDGDLEPGVLHVVAGRDGLVFLFALGEGASWRVLATRPTRGGDAPFGQPGGEVPLHDVQRILTNAGLNATVSDLVWSARVRLQHRLADSFRRGQLFLAGDAAHTHSPAAAQGMNTGILDAVNLGWKLAFASLDGVGPQLLDSYEDERRPVARQVLALTHAVFFAEASTSRLPAFLRGTLVPVVAPLVPRLVNQPLLMAAVVRLLSQGWVRYRHSVLSVDADPRGRGPRPGDRLPDEDVVYDGRSVRLHDLLAEPGVHVLLEQDAPAEFGQGPGSSVMVHRIESWPGTGLVAVRPDGHVGCRCRGSDPDELSRWLRVVGAS